MRILAGKHKNGLYSFRIISKNASFDSPKDFYKLSFSKPYYQEKWKAIRDAQRIAKKYWFLVTASLDAYEPHILNSNVMEDQIYAHYFESYKNLNEELKNLDHQDPEQRNYLFGKMNILKTEIEFFIKFIRPHKTKLTKDDFQKFINGIEKCQNEYFQKELEKYKTNPELFTPVEGGGEEGGGEGGGGLAGLLGSHKHRIITSASKSIDLDNYEVLETIAEELINATKDSESHFIINEKNKEIIIKNNDKEILFIGLNENFIISKIRPGKDNPLEYTDILFYQKYIKPILERLHLYDIKNGNIVLIKNLPNIPSLKPISFEISYLNGKTNKIEQSTLSLDPNSTWSFNI